MNCWIPGNSFQILKLKSYTNTIPCTPINTIAVEFKAVEHGPPILTGHSDHVTI